MSQKPYLMGSFTVTMLVVSFVVGMGIFKTPALVAATAGTPAIFFAAWAIGGLIALLGALTYAEIGTRLPEMGGFYRVFSHAYHPALGFTINALILVSNAASLAIVALIGADYVSDLLFGRPSGAVFNTGLAMVAVALFYAVNLLGLKTSSQTQNVMTVVKMGLVLLLIASVFTGLEIEPHGYEAGVQYAYNGSNGPRLLFLSLIAVCFTYGGYQQTINFGSEIKGGIIHRSISTGILIVLILYLAVNYAYVEVIGFEKIQNASAIGALLLKALFGPAGAKVFDFAMFLAVLAYVNILLMSNPRVMFAMSTDKVFPAIFGRRSAKTGALVPGLTAFALLTIAITFIGKGVDKILGFTMFLDSIGMCTSAAALFILRRRQIGQEYVRGRLTRFMPLITGLFVFGYGSVAIAVIVKEPLAAAMGMGLLLLFLVVYFLFYHRKR